MSFAVVVTTNQNGVPGRAPSTHRIAQAETRKIHQCLRGARRSAHSRTESGSQNGDGTASDPYARSLNWMARMYAMANAPPTTDPRYSIGREVVSMPGALTGQRITWHRHQRRCAASDPERRIS